MKFLIFLTLSFATIFADEYFATLEPINTYSIKAATSGEVIFANKDIEGKYASEAVIIKLDKTLNETELELTKQKIKVLEQMIEIEQRNYDRFKNLTSKSEFEKDAQKMKVLNYELQVGDLKTKVATLEEMISKKTIKEKNRFIYNIAVKEGDFVSSGTLLYETKDLSRAKLEIFIPIDKTDEYKKMAIYLDGARTNLKISKIFKVADSKYISSYKCEIVVPNPKKFSKLVKVEFR